MYAGSSMPVPLPKRQSSETSWCRRLCFASLLGVFLPLPAFAGARQAPPEVHLPLEDLGFPGISSTFLSVGASQLTVHFVDSQHLLVTFGLRGLVPRLPDDPPGHEDRMVAGLLLELPSGKVIARTQWHLHDHGRYLWCLGEGRFLLREGNELWTFAPVANLPSEHPFERTPFPHRHGSVEALLVSPDHRLVTVETRPRSSAQDSDTTSNDLGDRPLGSAVVLDFYRITGTGAKESPIVREAAGSVLAPSEMSLPMNADGYLHSVDTQNDGHWSVAFEPTNGKTIRLAPIDSSCPPELSLVSPTQFLAMSCRGNLGRTTVMAFDFNQHEMWEEPLGFVGQPVFSLAPAAGRFAINRVNSSASTDILPSDQDTPMSQEVRVYQTQTGDLLLKVSCSPVIRTSENFDLSEDGMQLAVIRKEALEVYRLPELTAADHADLADLQKIAPPQGSGPINLNAITATAAVSKPAAESIKPGDLTMTVSSSATAPGSEAVGDTPTRRKPPTLLNPGEKAEFQDRSVPQ
jgi:hypothetical protein